MFKYRGKYTKLYMSQKTVKLYISRNCMCVTYQDMKHILNLIAMEYIHEDWWKDIFCNALQNIYKFTVQRLNNESIVWWKMNVNVCFFCFCVYIRSLDYAIYTKEPHWLLYEKCTYMKYFFTILLIAIKIIWWWIIYKVWCIDKEDLRFGVQERFITRSLKIKLR